MPVAPRCDSYEKKQTCKPGQCGLIAICGAGGSGKSVTAVNLSASLAVAGKQVILVDLGFGVRPVRRLLGMETAASCTIRDFLSGKINSLHKAVVPTAFKGVSIIESGVDYLNRTDKTRQLKKNLVTKLLHLPADFVILDLGVLSDQTKIDYFLSADTRLMVVEPDPSLTPALGRLMTNLVTRAVELEFRKSAVMKKAASRIRGAQEQPGNTIIEELERSAQGKPEVMGKLGKLKEKPFFNIMVNKVETKRQIQFGNDLKKVLDDVSGLKIALAGLIPMDNLLKRAPVDCAPLVHVDPDAQVSKAFAEVAGTLTGMEQFKPDPNIMENIRREIELKKSETVEALETEISAIRAEKLEALETELKEMRQAHEKAFDDGLGGRRAQEETRMKTELREAGLQARQKMLEDLQADKRIRLENISRNVHDYENERISLWRLSLYSSIARSICASFSFPSKAIFSNKEACRLAICRSISRVRSSRRPDISSPSSSTFAERLEFISLSSSSSLVISIRRIDFSTWTIRSFS